MRWPEIVEVIKAQQGELGDFSELDWNAKCDILRSNPITVMRMFEKESRRSDDQPHPLTSKAHW
ncbi:hypothetical protein N1851_034043 [Merluccius polli]|nr:hypothetical protein N1851_034043 [Merluccius polli]